MLYLIPCAASTGNCCKGRGLNYICTEQQVLVQLYGASTWHISTNSREQSIWTPFIFSLAVWKKAWSGTILIREHDVVLYKLRNYVECMEHLCSNKLNLYMCTTKQTKEMKTRKLVLSSVARTMMEAVTMVQMAPYKFMEDSNTLAYLPNY